MYNSALPDENQDKVATNLMTGSDTPESRTVLPVKDFASGTFKTGQTEPNIVAPGAGHYVG